MAPTGGVRVSDGSDVVGITQRELLLEMRDDLRNLRAAVDIISRDQAISSDRRATMQATAAAIHTRLDSHEKAIADLQRWRDEAAGAIKLARWALGASLLASVLVIVQIIVTVRGGA